MFITRYQDLDTLIVREKSHKTEAGRTKWVAKQIDAGAIKVMAYGQGAALSQPVGTNEERTVKMVDFEPKVASTQILDDSQAHAWVVGCERADCAHSVLVAKYDYRPVNFADPNGPMVKTVYTAPGRRHCTAHMFA